MIRVLSVASEAYPLVKTGGLADVVGALPGALAPHNVTVTTLLPGYSAVTAVLKNAEPVHRYAALLGRYYWKDAAISARAAFQILLTFSHYFISLVAVFAWTALMCWRK